MINLQEVLNNLHLLTESEQIRLFEELEHLEQLQGKEKAQTNFLAFTERMWPEFIAGRHHKIMAEAFERVATGACKRLIICLPPRHALTLDTKIPTPDGWRTMQTVKEGDYVFGPDGEPVRVLGKSEVFKNRDLYRVTTDDGFHVDVDGEHLWTVNLGETLPLYGTYATEQLLTLQQKHKPQLPPVQVTHLLPLLGGKEPPQVRHISIEKLNTTADTQCIRADREDGLFLVGEGYVVTHNTKSEFASYLLPAWYLGRFPERKIIQASHTAELAMGFGRKVRNLIDTDTYKEVYPGVGLQADSKAAGRWGTNHGGTYFAIGVSGSVSGKGANLLILDDVHSEQEAIIAESNPDVYDKVYEWFMTGPRQRLQPNGAIVIVNTRWSKRDLTGRLLKDSVQRGGDEWEIIEFPALFEDDRPLWPEFWSKEELLALRASLPLSRWSAQYLQNPVSESAAIIKREWWQTWEGDTPPQCEFIMQSWDTAFLATERSDYSACTTWGVFYRGSGDGHLKPNIILLDAIKGRWEFPDLKLKAHQMYKDWAPDAVIVEAKAAGSPLIFELRRMGVPVQEFTPSRGADKIARLNAVADIFSSGSVWAPSKGWAEMVIEEVASFPAGEHDDLVDTVSQALIRYRKGGFLQLNSDEQDLDRAPPRKAAYY